MTYCVGHRGGLDLAFLCLWCGPAATASIQPWVRELPDASGVALESKKKKKKIISFTEDFSYRVITCFPRKCVSTTPGINLDIKKRTKQCGSSLCGYKGKRQAASQNLAEVHCLLELLPLEVFQVNFLGRKFPPVHREDQMLHYHRSPVYQHPRINWMSVKTYASQHTYTIDPWYSF